MVQSQSLIALIGELLYLETYHSIYVMYEQQQQKVQTKIKFLLPFLFLNLKICPTNSKNKTNI